MDETQEVSRNWSWLLNTRPGKTLYVDTARGLTMSVYSIRNKEDRRRVAHIMIPLRAQRVQASSEEDRLS
jgi:hypothetical protein